MLIIKPHGRCADRRNPLNAIRSPAERAKNLDAAGIADEPADQIVEPDNLHLDMLLAGIPYDIGQFDGKGFKIFGRRDDAAAPLAVFDVGEGQAPGILDDDFADVPGGVLEPLTDIGERKNFAEVDGVVIHSHDGPVAEGALAFVDRGVCDGRLKLVVVRGLVARGCECPKRLANLVFEKRGKKKFCSGLPTVVDPHDVGIFEDDEQRLAVTIDKRIHSEFSAVSRQFIRIDLVLDAGFDNPFAQPVNNPLGR